MNENHYQCKKYFSEHNTGIYRYDIWKMNTYEAEKQIIYVKKKLNYGFQEASILLNI